MNALSQDLSGPDAADLAAASLAMARRFAHGATLWCAAPSRPWLAAQMAAQLAQPAVAGGRSLPVAVVAGQLLESLRTRASAGDVLLVVAPPAEPSVMGLSQRAAAWGVLTVWIGTGERPLAGAADYVLFSDLEETSSPAGGPIACFCHALWEMTHTQLANPGLLKDGGGECNEEVCITCSDEGRLGEVVTLESDGLARVRTPSGLEMVDTSLVDGARTGDIVLIHAGSALSIVLPKGSGSEEAP